MNWTAALVCIYYLHCFDVLACQTDSLHDNDRSSEAAAFIGLSVHFLTMQISIGM